MQLRHLQLRRLPLRRELQLLGQVGGSGGWLPNFSRAARKIRAGRYPEADYGRDPSDAAGTVVA